jgi:hypothetical protein
VWPDAVVEGVVQDRACGIELADVPEAVADSAQQADSAAWDGAEALGMSSGLQDMRQQPSHAAIRRVGLHGHHWAFSQRRTSSRQGTDVPGRPASVTPGA